MSKFETEMTVHEIKGLLEGLERDIQYARFNLASDNVDELTYETTKMKMVIDRIENKINEQKRG